MGTERSVGLMNNPVLENDGQVKRSSHLRGCVKVSWIITTTRQHSHFHTEELRLEVRM